MQSTNQMNDNRTKFNRYQYILLHNQWYHHLISSALNKLHLKTL